MTCRCRQWIFLCSIFLFYIIIWNKILFQCLEGTCLPSGHLFGSGEAKEEHFTNGNKCLLLSVWGMLYSYMWSHPRASLKLWILQNKLYDNQTPYHSIHPLCARVQGTQACPFIPATEEKHNAMYNSSNSYKASSPAQASWTISYLCHNAWSVLVPRLRIISSNSVSELHLNVKWQRSTGSIMKC